MAISEQKRLFIGNLPPDIQDHDLQQEFSYYGAVDKVEVKQKKEPNSDVVQNTFAFITISIDDRTLNQCVQEFKEQKFRGRFLQVTVARENFLEKLKREREEASQTRQKKDESSVNAKEIINTKLPTLSTGNSSSSESSSDKSSDDETPMQQTKPVGKQNGSKKFGSSSGSSDDEDEAENDEDNLILKKKSKIFLENGKIKIDRNVSSGDAIHVIEKKTPKTNKRELDEKSKQADQKRLDSLNKMTNSYNEQKLAIKNALAGVDTAKKSNKIIFDDDGDAQSSVAIPIQSRKSTVETKSKEQKQSEKKPTLFEDDEDSDDEHAFEGNFEIKQQFEGKKGEKLRRLQDRFQADSRFKMDSKFLEDDSDNEKEQSASGQNEANFIAKSGDDIETNESDERQWQMNILESVIGKKMQSNTKKDTNKKAPPSMLRFDPTRAEHNKFVEPKVKKRKTKASNEPESKRRKTDDDYYDEGKKAEDNEPPVSMEHFYEVRGDLKKSMGSGGFSLLSMFNRPVENSQTTPADKPYEEKLIAKHGVKFLADFDPFKYDSSGDEADADGSKKKINTEAKPESDGMKSGLKYESFFVLNANDDRVSEGVSFFKPPEAAENGESNTNDYDDAQRQELKNIVKRKIRKSIQNALPRHAKPNKRFKRFAKNL